MSSRALTAFGAAHAELNMTPVRQNGFVESKGHTRQVSAECVAREGGFIGPETLRERRDWFDTFRGQSGQLGSWFAWCLGARGRVGVRLWRCMVGRREALPTAGSTPLESLRSHRPPSRAGPIHQGESRPWRSGKHLGSSGGGKGRSGIVGSGASGGFPIILPGQIHHHTPWSFPRLAGVVN